MKTLSVTFALAHMMASLPASEDALVALGLYRSPRQRQCVRTGLACILARGLATPDPETGMYVRTSLGDAWMRDHASRIEELVSALAPTAGKRGPRGWLAAREEARRLMAQHGHALAEGQVT